MFYTLYITFKKKASGIFAIFSRNADEKIAASFNSNSLDFSVKNAILLETESPKSNSKNKGFWQKVARNAAAFCP